VPRTTSYPCWSSRPPGRWRLPSVLWVACRSSWRTGPAGIVRCRPRLVCRPPSRSGSTKSCRGLVSTCPSLGWRCKRPSLFGSRRLYVKPEALAFGLLMSMSWRSEKQTENDAVFKRYCHTIMMVREFHWALNWWSEAAHIEVPRLLADICQRNHYLQRME
jgi:hypothetical protein